MLSIEEIQMIQLSRAPWGLRVASRTENFLISDPVFTCEVVLKLMIFVASRHKMILLNEFCVLVKKNWQIAAIIVSLQSSIPQSVNDFMMKSDECEH